MNVLECIARLEDLHAAVRIESALLKTHCPSAVLDEKRERELEALRTVTQWAKHAVSARSQSIPLTLRD